MIHDIGPKALEVQELLSDRWLAVESIADGLLTSKQLSAKTCLSIIEAAAVPPPIASVWADFQESQRQEEELRQRFGP